jgi:hypothetical protein
MARRKKRTKRGRDAKPGRFITIKEARRRAANAVVETIKIGRRRKKKPR